MRLAFRLNSFGRTQPPRIVLLDEGRGLSEPRRLGRTPNSGTKVPQRFLMRLRRGRLCPRRPRHRLPVDTFERHSIIFVSNLAEAVESTVRTETRFPETKGRTTASLSQELLNEAYDEVVE
jgi:hypothetical protein